MNGFEYNFTVIKGVQAKKEFYISMCPLKLVSKLFIDSENSNSAVQRIESRAKIVEISKHIIQNRNNYVFPPIIASIDREVAFDPISSEFGGNIGKLTIPMDSRIIINDGWHRKHAIEEAIKCQPDLSDENIPVVFFIDVDLKSSQQNHIFPITIVTDMRKDGLIEL